MKEMEILYRPLARAEPLAAPNVEHATNTGMIQLMTPNIRLAKS